MNEDVPAGLVAAFLISAVLLFVPIPCSAGEPQELTDDQIAESARVPMYGQPEVQRPADLARADSLLVRGLVEQFQGDRRAASVDLWAAGEWSLSQGNLNIAMSRYNQSWILDHAHYRSFWGFGRVLLSRNETGEAVRHLETAWRLCQTPTPNVAVQSALATAYSHHAARLQGTPDQRARYLALASKSFEECLKADPEYADGWLQWARALHREGKHGEAWMKVAKAREAGTELPASFLADLTKAMPEPKGGRP